MKIIIDESPLPQKRHKHASRGKFVTVYDPDKHHKIAIGKSALQQMNAHGWPRFEAGCNLIAWIDFQMPIAKSTRIDETNAVLWGFEYSNIKADIDNLEKKIFDALNGIAYDDDRQITHVYRKSKYLSYKPKTIITLMPAPLAELNEDVKGILKLIGPHEVLEFMSAAKEICDLYNSSREEDKELASQLHDPTLKNLYEVRLIRTAELFSFLADKFEDKFRKIAKKHPKVWQKMNCQRKEMI